MLGDMFQSMLWWGRFRMMFGRSRHFRNRKELLEAVHQFLQFPVADKQFLDLGTKYCTLTCGLLMSKYVKVVLHVL